jgi:hypothetical protein
LFILALLFTIFSSRFSLSTFLLKLYFLRLAPRVFSLRFAESFSFFFGSLLALTLFLLSQSSAAPSFVQVSQTNLFNRAHNPLQAQIVALLLQSRSTRCRPVQN